MYYFVNILIFSFSGFVTDTKSLEYKHTQSAQCGLIKTDITGQLIASLKVEQKGYRHFPNTTVH